MAVEDLEEETRKRAAPDPDLEEQLLEDGNKLTDPPSSVEELLSLLDQVDSRLSRVEQSPSSSMLDALTPSFKALVANKLLRHSDADVKVAVASCISEVTRITAPEAPYDDDQMKEVFQLIVSSFENLYDKTSRSYAKRTSILETVAKVRSCVVMLDLECDALILKMFQHFLKEIREHHSDNVFTSMEIIMTLVLEESEDIPLELLSPLLDSVKKDNEEVFPIAKKLGEKVLENCATKVKPYLLQAVKSLDISLDDYSKVLASICQDASDSLEQNDVCEQREEMCNSGKQLPEESEQMVKEGESEAVPSQQDNPVGDRSPKAVVSNGVAKVKEDFNLAESKSLKNEDDTDCSDKSKDENIAGHEEANDLNTDKVDNKGQKPEQPTKGRGRKSSSSSKSAEPFEGQVAGNVKEAEKTLDSESQSKEVPSSLHEDHSVEAAGPSQNDEEIDAKISSPKAGHDNSEVIGSPSPVESLHDKNRSKKIGRSKAKVVSAKDVAADDVPKVTDVTSDSEAKPAKQSVKKTLGKKSDVKKTSVADSVKNESGATSDTDTKKHSAKKLDETNKGDGGSSSRQSEKKKSGRGKPSSEKVVVKSSAKDVDKEMVSYPRSGTKSTKNKSSVETPKTNVKRKHSSGTENESDIKEYGQNLVGLRIKVWWPEDKEFYEGVIDSFDPATKKHKVHYDDDEVEILRLRKETWKIIEPADSDSDEEEGSDQASLASADMPPKKKGKTSTGDSSKQRKMDASSKSGGEKASSKSKVASTKSNSKSKDGRKSKDSPTDSESEDEELGKKSKDNTSRSVGSKSVAAAQKMSGKSKNTSTSKTSKPKDDSSTPKHSKSKEVTPKSGKSKQETLKAVASKGKPPKSGGTGKSNVNGSGKMRSGTLKRKDSEIEDSDATDTSEGEVEDTKSKASSSSKAQRSEAKSGKKRRKT